MFIRNFLKKFSENTDQQKNVELGYWEKKLRDGNHATYVERYEIIKNLFPQKYLVPAERVADVGSGPMGGIFSSSSWPVMVALDPLWPEYEKHFQHLFDEKVTKVSGVAEDLPQDGFDLIWAVNSLDHSGNLKTSLTHLISCLSPGGRLLLHIHMRTKEQLNKAHKMIVTERQLQKYCSWDWSQILSQCPIEGKDYKTWLGVHVRR